MGAPGGGGTGSTVILRPAMPWWDTGRSESACVCLLFLAEYAASYEGNWCLVRPPHQPGPSMTLNILSRQTSDPSPKESPDFNPGQSSNPAPGPRLSPVEKPSHSLLCPGLLQAYLCFSLLASLSSMQQPESYYNLHQISCLLGSEACNGSHPRQSKTQSPFRDQ